MRRFLYLALTFSSFAMFEAQNCTTMCPQIISYICVCNGQNCTTYNNQCYYDNDKCSNPERNYANDEVKPGICNQTNAQEANKENNTQGCNEFCDKTYFPLCVFDGESYTTYPNECMFKLAKCKNMDKSYEVLYEGFCECRKPTFCPMIYDPVCIWDGFNKTTYPSNCSFIADQNTYRDITYAFLYNGECDDCKENCTNEIEPVCVYDGESYQSYINKCYYECAKGKYSENEEKYFIVGNDKCSDS